MGLTLFIVGILLNMLLALPALLHTIVGAFRYRGKYAYVDDAFYRGAKALDIFGNVAYGTLLNDLLIKKGGYHYGQGSEKISSATGKNWVKGKLTFMGKCLASFLNMIDWKNWQSGGHCWTSIEGDRAEYDSMGLPDPLPKYYAVLFVLFLFIVFRLIIKLYIWIL